MSRLLSTVTAATLAMGLASASPAAAASHSGDGWIVKPSGGTVAETVDRLVGAVEGAGATVFATVDHAAGAKSIDAELADMTLVVFGNPKIGTPILQANPQAGLDLPIRVLIWDDGGQTQIGYLDPQALKARYGVEGADKAFMMMGGALDKLTNAAAGEN